MDETAINLFAEINRGVIKFRGIYATWSRRHGISYNEMLVLYTIREHGYCTQKQICDSYLLPRQTINHVFSDLRKRGLLTRSPEHLANREKSFKLTAEGRAYAEPLLNSLNRIEQRAVELLGEEQIHATAQAVQAFDQVLQTAMEETT